MFQRSTTREKISFQKYKIQYFLIVLGNITNLFFIKEKNIHTLSKHWFNIYQQIQTCLQTNQFQLEWNPVQEKYRNLVIIKYNIVISMWVKALNSVQIYNMTLGDGQWWSFHIIPCNQFYKWLKWVCVCIYLNKSILCSNNIQKDDFSE